MGFAFYRGADCCALCFDLTNPASFEALDKWKEGFIENAGPDDPKTFPFVLIGNKVDRTDDRRVDASKPEAWCKENNDMQYFETSAKEGVSVNEAFVAMVKMGIKREQNNNQFIMPDSIAGQGGAGGIKLQGNKRGQTNVKANSCC